MLHTSTADSTCIVFECAYFTLGVEVINKPLMENVVKNAVFVNVQSKVVKQSKISFFMIFFFIGWFDFIANHYTILLSKDITRLYFRGQT